jgi:murein DD-endopeptidase MepM/ murein hydrolase activator NlpD
MSSRFCRRLEVSMGLVGLAAGLLAACLPTSGQPPSAAGESPTPSPAIAGTATPVPTLDIAAAAATAGVTLPPGFETPINAAAGEQLVIPTSGTPVQYVFPTPIIFQPPPNWRPPVLSVPLSVRSQDHFWFARPIASDSVNYPLGTYRYGSTYYGQMNIHAGIDIDAPMYTPVLAAGPGRVVWAGYGLFNFEPRRADDPYGNAVAILHDFGFNNQPLYTLYAHMVAHDVYVGQDVKTGDVLGWVGSTGNSTGPHLHFEVREGVNGYYDTRNPELWVAPYAGWGVLAGRLTTSSGRLIPSTQINIYDANGNFVHIVSTYGPRVAHPDDAWKENFAISDLPAGTYFLQATIEKPISETETIVGSVTVIAGQTNFVILQADSGMLADMQPDIVRPEFLPSLTPSNTPTATSTRTPTATRTPTSTRTATSTHLPTYTPIPSRTPRSSATISHP